MKLQIVSPRVTVLLDQVRQLAELGFARVGNIEVLWVHHDPKEVPRVHYFQTLKK